ncbi:hypothetical protein IFT73_06220 [Aeromicrobium sp. CFBP 8757]|uniref:hypothetical protein n=1 Tax=Aeromicrobium sp. CFBP 8757 TaxID=2775288 RepID=UPI00177C2874|nr:hypothetical protein [Aeromicrobium sp. CFBP 8757]MBD8606445.1 hypothetical protein [Aeromicrobium sp. CFBP 8757]
MSDRRLRHGLPRLARAGFVALLTMTLSVAAHVHAGGQAPTTAAMAALVAVFAGVCWALSSQRWTARPLLAVFLLAQAATHLTAMVQHPMDSMGSMSGGTMLSAPMVSSHVAAAAVLLLMVTRGETALVRLVEHLTLRCLDLRVVPTPQRADAPVADAVPSPVAHLLVSTVRGRAPPCSPVLHVA